MNYLSVCSGIEAASVAWHPLGWKPFAFSEIEKFPSQVLAHHYPDVPNLGDMTKYREWPNAAIKLLVGGTPCQSFSVAGLRKGLGDPRGNLMLTYGAIAGKYRPRWLVWENVPGVLSSNGGRDFGTFLGMLAELGYGFAYRILDAQYIRVDGFARAVPQRRRRVFVVGYFGDWRRAAAVLFERESLCGHPAPSRKAGEGTSSIVARSLAIRGRDGTPQAELGEDIANAILTPSGGRAGIGVGAIMHSVAHSLRGEGFDASEDGTGRGTPLIPIAFTCKDHGADAGEVSPTLRSMSHDGSHANGGGQVAVAFAQNQRDEVRMMHVAGALAAEPGAKQQTYAQIGMAVRRLTPTECERLQGFPDGYTDIRHGGKAAPDGPRYKALGNSMAIPPMRWLGQRIAMVDAVQALQVAA